MAFVYPAIGCTAKCKALDSFGLAWVYLGFFQQTHCSFLYSQNLSHQRIGIKVVYTIVHVAVLHARKRLPSADLAGTDRLGPNQ